jgi:hypothetical protein
MALKNLNGPLGIVCVKYTSIVKKQSKVTALIEEQDGNVRISIILRPFRATIIAVDNQVSTKCYECLFP